MAHRPLARPDLSEDDIIDTQLIDTQPDTDALTVSMQLRGGVAVVRCEGRLHQRAASTILQLVDLALGSRPCGVVADLAQARLSRDTLWLLSMIRWHVTNRGLPFLLAGACPEVRSLLDDVRDDQVAQSVGAACSVIPRRA